MENKENSKASSAADKETSTEATIERGKAATKADEQISNKNSDDPKVTTDKEKDAGQWRNEG